jgi:hypothetical protein
MGFRHVRLVIAVLLGMCLSGFSMPAGAAPAVAPHHQASLLLPPSSFLDDDNGNDDGDDDGGGEEGDDDDGDDDNDRDNEEENDNRAENRGNDESAEPVAPTVGYTVTVMCDYDSAADQTACTFQGQTPQGAQDISHVDIPDTAVCADVIGGEYEAVDPDPNTGVTGFKSRGSTGQLTLILAGEVTVGGSATYWIKAADRVFPVTGPGLQCDGATPTAAIATPPAEPGSSEAGSLVITVAECPSEPTDDDDFDWYGECQAGPSDHRFQLTDRASGRELELVPTVSNDGLVIYAPLTPGEYELEPADGSWCHAESDNVTSEGYVVIEDQRVTSVWFFYCPREHSGS